MEEGGGGGRVRGRGGGGGAVHNATLSPPKCF